ncbi:hypothetical protein BCR39DRAFT_546348 [Naematelia encephala]|uniref:Uncharacterized protein n=1 Tax=Naematelia encephala TaxID=71784 RepID=A0A1Y2AQ56_9TREE|nr:hypothetical protein BCR39DRAFT_546348 [Naematelia encephala]
MSSSTGTGTAKTIPTSLVIFTTSQSPLGLRYEHPRKPLLVIPPLIHRSLHAALDGETPSVLIQDGISYLPHPDTLGKQDIPTRPTGPPSSSSSSSSPVIADPILDSQPARIISRGDSEITVKFHLVGNGTSTDKVKWIEDGLELLGRYKGLNQVDTLLVGFKGIDYRGKKTAASEMFGCGAEGLESDTGSEDVSDQARKQVLDIWQDVKAKVEGKVGRIGTMYLPLGLLKDVKELDGKLAVNALDTPDCHSLPKDYSGWAKESGVELWAGGGGEGSDPLPSVHLHNLLSEFNDKINTLGVSHGAGDVILLRKDGLKFEQGGKLAVDVRWVLSYTLVSSTRGLVRDKGYIVMADIVP